MGKNKEHSRLFNKCHGTKEYWGVEENIRTFVTLKPYKVCLS